MKRSFRRAFLCAVAFGAVWAVAFRDTPDKMLPFGEASDKLGDLTDMGLARDYIREKLPLIRGILGDMFRFFGRMGDRICG